MLRLKGLKEGIKDEGGDLDFLVTENEYGFESDEWKARGESMIKAVAIL